MYIKREMENGSWFKQSLEIVFFGVRVSLSGDRLIVTQFISHSESGVYIYERKNGIWEQVQKFTEPSLGSGNSTSFSVAYSEVGISGDAAIAGKYIYEKKNGVWVKVQELKGEGILGTGAAISGDKIAVNSQVFDSPNELHILNTYIYEKRNGIWEEVHKFSQNGFIIHNAHLTPLSITEDIVVAGSEHENGVHIYGKKNGVWEEVQKLTRDETRGFRL